MQYKYFSKVNTKLVKVVLLNKKDRHIYLSKIKNSNKISDLYLKIQESI